jgi:molecular chaperone DnaK (HSP70)
MIGRRFDDKVIQDEIPRWPFKVVDDDGDIQISVLNELYSPEDISGMVLKRLKENAENRLDKTIEDVVITVPAYFNDRQRQGTMKAAAKAGLNVLRMISEPSAAALAYGLDKHFTGKRTVLIYDLGGGTFDVSILKIQEGYFETLSTSGDTHLGGQDFDNKLFDYLVKEFNHNCPVNLNYYKDEADKKIKEKSKRKLMEHCQDAKHRLSEAERVEIVIEGFYKDIDYLETVTRQQFEDLNKDLFQKTQKCINAALIGANLNHDDIDDVVLVGGSTKIPKIQKIIRATFTKSEIIKTVNVDEAVVIGAALEAAKQAKNIPKNFRVADITEVTPFSLGIECTRDKFIRVVNRYTTIPLTKSKIFVTAEDQTAIRFSVYEGENNLCKNNHLLGEFSLHDVPSLPAGQAKFDCSFKIDLNGILKVTAVDKQTGQQKSIDISYKRARNVEPSVRER